MSGIVCMFFICAACKNRVCIEGEAVKLCSFTVGQIKLEKKNIKRTVNLIYMVVSAWKVENVGIFMACSSKKK